MMVARHVAIVVWSAIRFGFSTRNLVVILLVVGGLLLVLAI